MAEGSVSFFPDYRYNVDATGKRIEKSLGSVEGHLACLATAFSNVLLMSTGVGGKGTQPFPRVQ